MSPWASASRDQHAGDRASLGHHPAELLGDAEHVDAELGGLRRAARRGSRRRSSRLSAAGRTFSAAKSRDRLLEHLLLLVGREVEQAARLCRCLACRAAVAAARALKVRPAAVAERKPLVAPRKTARSSGLRDPDAVEQLGAGERGSAPAGRGPCRARRALGVGGRHFALLLPRRGLLRCGLEVRDPSVEVRRALAWRRASAKRNARCRRRSARELNATARQQDRLAEAGHRRRRPPAGGSRAPPGIAPCVHMPCAIAPREAEQSWRSARACGSGCGRPRPRRSDGRGHRPRAPLAACAAQASASRSLPRLRAARTPAAGAAPAARGAASCCALPDDLPADARLGDERERAAAGVRARAAWCRTRRSSAPRGRIGRCWRIRFSMWTSPTAPNGKRRRSSAPSAAGRRARAGRWAAGGRAGRSRRPRRRRRGARDRSRTPSSCSSSSGISPPPRRDERQQRGAGHAAARARAHTAAGRAGGLAERSRCAISGPQQALAADAHDVAVDPGRGGVREARRSSRRRRRAARPGARLFMRRPASRIAIGIAAVIFGLDEARGDRVDRRAAPGKLGRERLAPCPITPALEVA